MQYNRIINEASANNIRYIEGKVENKRNTVPFDIELITLLNFMSEEELVAHLNNVLPFKIQVIEQEQEEAK